MVAPSVVVETNHVEETESSSKRRMESGETDPRDGGLGSSVCGEEPPTAPGGPAAAGTAAKQNSCDSGQGSEPDDGIRLAYHFYIPAYLCGMSNTFTTLFFHGDVFAINSFVASAEKNRKVV